MAKLNVEFELSQNCKQLQVEDINFELWRAKFRDQEVPVQFASLLLNPTLRGRAVALFQKALTEIERTSKINAVFNEILESAAKEGIEKAEEKLQHIADARPNGEPKLYRSLEHDQYGNPYMGYQKHVRITMTDGTKAFSFSTEENIDALPLNVYCKEEWVSEKFDKRMMDAFSARPKEFFDVFAKAESLRTNYVYSAWSILVTFVEGRESYGRILADAETYHQFVTGSLKCPQGYIFYKDTNRGWCYAYLVTKEGDVYQFAKRGEHELHNFVMSLVKGETSIRNLKKQCPTREDFQDIAKHVSQVDAALVLVLLPDDATCKTS